MKFRNSAPTILIAAVVAVVAVTSVVSNLISHRMAASFEEQQFTLMGQILHSKLHGAEGKAIAAAEAIAAIPSVKKAFAARNRDELLATTRETYAIQHEKYGLSQAQFHLPPAVSFLRVHNPEKFGDDLAQTRQMVVEVNRMNGIRKGIEITSSGIAVFGTMPMADDKGKPVGSFEVGMEIGPLLDELKKAYGFELALFINEKMLHETATALKGDVFNAQNRVGQYVKFYSTHPELLRELVGDDDANVQDETHYLRDAGGVPHGVLLQPVYNYAKKPIGFVAMAKNFSATRSADGQSMVWQTLLGILAIVLLVGVILTVLRGMLLRPLADLGERVGELAAGTAPVATEIPDGYCDEMRILAENCQRLAKRSAVRDAGAEGTSQ